MTPEARTDLAVVLAAGRGTRLRVESSHARLSVDQASAADAGRKVMMPVGRPFMDYVLHRLAESGFSAVVIVVPPEHHDLLARYSRDVVPQRITLRFAIQAEPRGTADALLAAHDMINRSPFVVVNGDNLYPVDALSAAACLDGAGLVGFDRAALVRHSNFGQDRISRFAVLEVDPAGWLRSIVEKPDADTLRRLGPDAPISMNCWRFTPSIFDACRRVEPSSRGEIELQDAVRLALEEGHPFRVLPFGGGVIDLTTRDDVASVVERTAGTRVRL